MNTTTTPPTRWQIWYTILVIAWRAHPPAATLALIGWLLTTVLAGPVLATALSQITTHPLWYAALAIALVLPETILHLTDAYRHYLQKRCQALIDHRLIHAALHRSTPQHETAPETLDDQHFAHQHARRLADAYVTIAGALGLLGGFVVSAGMLWSIHPLLVVPTGLAAGFGWAHVWVARTVERWRAETVRSSRLVDDVVAHSCAPAHQIVVRTTPVMGQVRQVYDQVAAQHERLVWRSGLRAAALSAASHVVQVLAAAVLLGLTLWWYAAGVLRAVDVVAVVALTQFVLESARGLVGNVTALAQGYRLGERLLRCAPTGVRSRDVTVGGAGLPSGPLQLHQVSYQYPGASVAALRDVTVTLKPGTVYAVAGANGAGKTTLVQVLSRMVNPTSGTITYNQVPFTDIPREQWHAGLRMIHQQYLRGPFPLHENVAIGDVGQLQNAAPGDLAQVTAAHLRTVGAPDLATHCVPGHDRDDDAVQLSTGQWQKVATARSLMRTTPTVVIVDEPTAALDPRSEYDAFAQLINHARGERACGTIWVFVTHRYSSAALADQVIHMADGTVTHIAPHAEQLAQNPTYARNYRRYQKLCE